MRRRILITTLLADALVLVGCGGIPTGQEPPSPLVTSTAPVAVSGNASASLAGTPTSQPASTTVALASVALSQLESSTTVYSSAVSVEPTPTPAAAGISTVKATPTTSAATAVTVAQIPIAGVAAPTATALAPVSTEVIDIFERFLQVYAQALRTLDTSHLDSVLSGQALQGITDEVNTLKAQGRSVELVETNHRVGFDQLTVDRAVLVDEYDSASVYIDHSTGQPLPRTGPPQRIRMVYQFRKSGGAWKIAQSAQKILGTATP